MACEWLFEVDSRDVVRKCSADENGKICVHTVRTCSTQLVCLPTYMSVLKSSLNTTVTQGRWRVLTITGALFMIYSAAFSGSLGRRPTTPVTLSHTNNTVTNAMTNTTVSTV